VPLRNLEERGRTLLSQGLKASANKNFDESNSFLDKAMDIFKYAFGEEYPVIYDIFLSKAKNFTQLSRFEEADQNFHNAIEISNKFRSNRTELLKVHIDKAWSLVQREHYDQAQYYYNKGFEIAEDGSNKYHTLLMRMLDDIAEMHHRKGELDQALEYHFRALAQVDNLSREHQPIKARILTHIAIVFEELGDNEESKIYLKMAKELFDKSTPTEEEPELAFCYSALAYSSPIKQSVGHALTLMRKTTDIGPTTSTNEKTDSKI